MPELSTKQSIWSPWLFRCILLRKAPFLKMRCFKIQSKVVVFFWSSAANYRIVFIHIIRSTYSKTSVKWAHPLGPFEPPQCPCLGILQQLKQKTMQMNVIDRSDLFHSRSSQIPSVENEIHIPAHNLTTGKYMTVHVFPDSFSLLLTIPSYSRCIIINKSKAPGHPQQRG